MVSIPYFREGSHMFESQNSHKKNHNLISEPPYPFEVQPSYPIDKSIIEKQVEPICIWQSDGYIVFVNHAFCELFNLSKDSILGYRYRSIQNESLLDFLTCESLPGNILKNGKPVTAIQQIHASNGNLIWINWVNQLVSDDAEDPGLIFTIGHDLSEYKKMDDAIQRHDAVLDAISQSAKEFMLTSNLEETIQNLLQRLGKATKVSRVYLMQENTEPNGELHSHQVYEWADDGVSPQINNQILQDFPTQSKFPGQAFWLREGQPIVVKTSDLPPEKRKFFIDQDIKSLLMFPIIVDHHHWGHIGFDDCQDDRDWTNIDINSLQASAGILGAAIARKGYLQTLEAQNQHLVNLSRQLIEIQESERRSLALELHDEIGQTLTGIRLSLEGLKQQVNSNCREKISLSLDLIGNLTQHVKDISLSLRPSVLDDLGLLPALLWMFENFTSQSKIVVNFQHVGISDRRFRAEIETNIYRIIQEALTNVARHAEVENVSVKIWCTPNIIGFKIEDNGKGFVLDQSEKGFMSIGLISMKDRAQSIGGNLIIDTFPRSGTSITVEIPISTITP